MNNWEEEFEDEWKCVCSDYDEIAVCLEKGDIQKLFYIYMNSKVKIKARDGCIMIEKIKEKDLLTCSYCGRLAPEKEFLTKNGCISCDVDYHRSLCEIKNEK